MTNGKYTVQLHMHTSETSRCGKAGGAEMARAAKALGYDTIVITDHFFNANNVCNDHPEWTWPEKVSVMSRGYEAAKAAGDEIGLTVLFGWETFNDGHEFLTYGLSRRFLLEHPEMTNMSPGEYVAFAVKNGARLIYAHPFRRAWYIPEYAPDPAGMRYAEAYNAANSHPEWNDQAKAFCAENGLIATAGSDAHWPEALKGGAMRFPEPVDTFDKLFAALDKGDGEIAEVL